MNLEQIDISFLHLLKKGKAGIRTRKKIKMRADRAASYRHAMRSGKNISIELKLSWLQRAGIFIQQQESFTKKDLVSLLKFAHIRAGAAAKSLGPEYIIEKWQKLKNQ